ncbi:hypothetical protein H2508_03170 [Parahaliea sp. F7430]|uniref:Uncharacterized protein n=1 Tax=Sediminihaliea albiluteola TaxID=2758564 RepID=A0A7W2TUF5_9GAMM|nr:DUF6763 family protein [Sediminihaliea albiluteola]MBA6412106.1 hypothetical protein [Sediminihaliea albiluteola]
MKMLSPTVGGWYKDLETHELFEVVAWDSATLSIEAQFFDGEVTEYDLDTWRQLKLREIEPPEDWRSPFELDDEDRLDPDLPHQPLEWNSPVNTIEPDAMYGVED